MVEAKRILAINVICVDGRAIVQERYKARNNIVVNRLLGVGATDKMRVYARNKLKELPKQAAYGEMHQEKLDELRDAILLRKAKSGLVL